MLSKIIFVFFIKEYNFYYYKNKRTFFYINYPFIKLPLCEIMREKGNQKVKKYSKSGKEKYDSRFFFIILR